MEAALYAPGILVLHGIGKVCGQYTIKINTVITVYCYISKASKKVFNTTSNKHSSLTYKLITLGRNCHNANVVFNCRLLHNTLKSYNTNATF